ncbi:MAG: AMP-binding protein [Pseudomonadota bacterium]
MSIDSEKPWLSEYPDWLPHDVDQGRIKLLHQYLWDAADEFPERPAFTNFGKTLNYRELRDTATTFGRNLVEHGGMKPGDRLAVMLPNLLQYPIVLFGALSQGLIVVNVNPLYTARELRHQLKDSGAGAIVVLENFAHVLAEVIDDTEVSTAIVTKVGDCLPTAKAMLLNTVLKYVKKAVPPWDIDHALTFKELMTRHSDVQSEPVEIDPNDLAFLQYTGGTTGLSKGVELTHRNISANVEQAISWTSNEIRRGEEIAITALPLYHIFALTANCFFITALAGLNVLVTNPRDFKGFVKELSRWKFTYITGVNTLYAALLNTPGFKSLDFSALKISLGAGMAVTRPVAEQWKSVTGRTLIELYGLSEASPAVSANLMDLEDYNGSVGLPVASTIAVICDEQGKPLQIGQEGELCVSGPQVMRGYWKNADATREAFTENGYLRTGDWAVMDEKGFIRLLDRKKDMVIVSGFNVYPNEIEDVVSAHPGVFEVAAIGVDDEKSGERVKLFVVRNDEALSEEALIEWCKTQLTSYKRPKLVEFRDELPKSAVGKILRRALR